MTLFRIAMGCLALTSAYNTVHLYELYEANYAAALSGALPSFLELHSAVNCLQGLWFLTGILMVLGLTNRSILALQYSLALLLCVGGQIEHTLFICASFWTCFMRLDQHLSLRSCLPTRFTNTPSTRPASAWPCFLLGTNLSLFLFGAGIHKVHDPAWRQGLGFYYTFLQPWVRVGFLDELLDSKWLMLAANYLGIIGQIVVLPLFLIPRFRWLACCLLSGFFAHLIWPLRIDPVGPIGLTMTLAGWSLCLQSSERKDLVSRGEQRLASILAGHLCFCYAMIALPALWEIRFPEVRMPLRLEGAPKLTQSDAVLATDEDWDFLSKKQKFERLWSQGQYGEIIKKIWVGSGLADGLHTLNRASVQVYPLALFNTNHTLGMYVYKAQVELDNGALVEPVEVFKWDKTAGPYSFASSSNQLAGQRAILSAICQWLCEDPEKEIPERHREKVKGLARYILKKLPRTQQERSLRVHFLCSALEMPSQFEGNVKPWMETPWAPIASYQKVDGTLSISKIAPTSHQLQLSAGDGSGRKIVVGAYPR